MKRNKVNRGYTLRIAIGIPMLALILLSGGAAAQGMTWHVLAGGETPDMAMQGMGFYPGVITINAGDTINWTLGGNLVHTVSFLSGAPAPQPGSPESLAPAGGSTYNGTGIVSSGVMTPGMSYLLNFTTPGTYAYQCLLHPGMAGAVIVKPAGSPYPHTQDQYTAQGKQELQADLDTGQRILENLSLTTTPGPNGTTVWHAASDIPLPMNASILLSPQNNSSATGNAMLNFVGPGTLQVKMQLSGLVPNSVHPAHIHTGTCADGGPVTYPLNDLKAGPDGNATSTTTINGPPWFAISDRGWFINVHTGPTMSDGGATPISCGDVVKNGVALMRFVPENFTIHTGDKVVWTQLNPMEIHTVTFLAAGQGIPGFPSPEAIAPSGGSSYNGTGYFNSGVLLPGQNYTLTFTKPGTYNYICIIHVGLGMVGQVVVLPAAVTTPAVTTPAGPIPVPEFPSAVLPVTAVIGLMALLLYKRRK